MEKLTALQHIQKYKLEGDVLIYEPVTPDKQIQYIWHQTGKSHTIHHISGEKVADWEIIEMVENSAVLAEYRDGLPILQVIF